MINVPIISTWNPKGINKAGKSLNAFDKSVKKLGKSFASVFAARKVIAFGEASLKAFIEDDKAAQVLAKTMENLGMAFANPQIKTFINDMEAQFHVVDDKLRPAFQKLTTVTGDYQLAQKLLKTSLNLAAMSGQDLATTSADIGKAFVGQTRGLLKYQTGLTKAELAAFSFDQILTQINKVSMGQAELAANTYTGQLDALNIAANNAKETIGKGLVQALIEASNAGNLDNAISGIDKLAGKTSDLIIYVERELQIAMAFPSIIEILNGDYDAFRKFKNAFDKVKALDAQRKPQQYGGIYATQYANQAMDSKRKLDAAKLAKEKAAELKLLRDKNTQTLLDAKMKKDQAALDELKKRFDVERIGLQAALLKATDEETKARIRAQIAMLDETGSTAQKAIDALDKAQADKLANELKAASALEKLAAAADGVFTIFTTKVPFIGDVQGPGLKPSVTMPSQAELDAVAADVAAEAKKREADRLAALAKSGFGDIQPPFPGNGVNPDFHNGGRMVASAFNSDYSMGSGSVVTPMATGSKTSTIYIDNSIHVGEGGTVVDPTTVTEIVRSAVQQNNRYGSSLQYAGNIAV